MNLLPLIVLFVLPMLSTLLSGSGLSGPEIRDFKDSRFTKTRMSRPRGIYKYWLDPNQVSEYTEKNFYDLDRQAETRYIQRLQYGCQDEVEQRNRMIQDAQGIFFTDHARVDRARKMKLPSCSKLKEHGLKADWFSRAMVRRYLMGLSGYSKHFARRLYRMFIIVVGSYQAFWKLWLEVQWSGWPLCIESYVHLQLLHRILNDSERRISPPQSSQWTRQPTVRYHISVAKLHVLFNFRVLDISRCQRSTLQDLKLPNHKPHRILF